MRPRDSVTLDDDVRGVLLPWLERQRWYSGKGHKPQARLIGSWDLPSDDGDAVSRTFLLMEEGGRRPVLYQVPFTIREEPLVDASDGLIGSIGGGVRPRRYLYDGPRDPAYAGALLSSIARGDEVRGANAAAHGSPSGQLDLGNARSRILNAEQSNTSIVYEPVDGKDGFRPIICKVFRTLHHGDNPDVELESALSAAGSAHVPSVIGSLSAEWLDAGREGGRADGHVAFAQEFVGGSEDGWSLALREARAGGDFRKRARALGEATAEVHIQLATIFPSHAAHTSRIEGIVRGWHSRLALAVAEVPGVAEVAPAIESLYAIAAAGPWPSFQRIHGDFHLGQVLAAPDGRWLLIDFEGEPLRPMNERSQPDIAARDIAGMLRSFDYVAATLADVGGAREWAEASRDAFLSGYSESRPGAAEYVTLLDAFETDKAVYEAVYEARNRPQWLQIPLTALHRLAARAVH